MTRQEWLQSGPAPQIRTPSGLPTLGGSHMFDHRRKSSQLPPVGPGPQTTTNRLDANKVVNMAKKFQVDFDRPGPESGHNRVVIGSGGFKNMNVIEMKKRIESTLRKPRRSV